MMVGAGAVVVGKDYELGTAHNMGPGYVPAFLGWILIALGLAKAAISVSRGAPETLEPIPYLPLFLIVFSIVAFGLLIEDAGMLIAVAAVMVISSLASRPIKPISTGLSLIILLIITSSLFVYGLDRPLSHLLPH